MNGAQVVAENYLLESDRACKDLDEGNRQSSMDREKADSLCFAKPLRKEHHQGEQQLGHKNRNHALWGWSTEDG